MPRYIGHVITIVPNVANDNFALEAASGESGRITELRFSSGETNIVSMATQFTRTSGNGTTPSAGNVQKRHPNSDPNKITFVSSWGGVQPTLDPGALLAEDWLSNGGIVRWLAGPDEELIILGAEQLSCRNTLGTELSTYRAVWDED